MLNDETIVAVYDTAAHADAAVRDLKAAHVPVDAISVHVKGDATATAPAHEPGFWASLFGGESSDAPTYARSFESGSTVVTVKTVPQIDVAKVGTILGKHNPIDFDERSNSYRTTETSHSTTGMPKGKESGGDSIQLAEEQLTVGKRAVNLGTTRVRRYVVETPVQENVSLHSEKVTIDRRPVTDGRAVNAADFTDKTIEATATSEEAVVGKTARVVEEVRLRKEAVDRTETVRDTVRREEVKIEQVPAAETRTDSVTRKI